MVAIETFILSRERERWEGEERRKGRKLNEGKEKVRT